MRHRKLVDVIAAAFVAASVVAASFVGAPSPANAAPDPVLSVDFDDGEVAPLMNSGAPTLEIVDGGVTGNALKVSNRSESWATVQTPTGLFASGTTYTLSAQIRLIDEASAPTQAHFTVDDGDYTWVGTADVTADDWTLVSGTYTLPAKADPAATKASIEVGGAAPWPDFLVDDVTITAQDAVNPDPNQPPGTQVIASGFEDGLDAWVSRETGSGKGVLTLTSDDAHSGTQAALLTERTSQGDGIGRDVSDLFTPGTTYELSAWVRFAPGQETDDVWLSMARTIDGSTSYDTLAQFSGMSNTGWVRVTAKFQMSEADSALLYFETAYDGGATGNTSDLLLDDVSVIVPEAAQIQDLIPIKDTLPFPVGVAIDSRETRGAAAELLLRHFNQITGENYMKPEAWYNADQQFAPGAETNALMDFGRDEGIDVYGHTLVWHSQTPAWFFQDASGNPLTTSAADQQVLRDRMHDHIFAVAEYLSDNYGLFGSPENPLTAFDVVNEVIADGSEHADGLRRSEWYRILGEEYLDLAFHYADDAFNGTFAAPGSQRPVTLFINDYNTEQVGKQQRLHAVVARLLERGVLVDGVGHQFHVSLATSVSTLQDAIVAFEDLPVTQAVTEFDVTTGTPVTEAKLIDQGYFYRDAFRVFREHAESLFSVTVWGLTDGRSWRASSGDPLVFNDDLQAKPAYYGVIDGALPPLLRTANVFQGDVALDEQATDALEWKQLPLHEINDGSGFQMRWDEDHLTVFVTVEDATVDSRDAIQFVYGGEEVTLGRAGSGAAQGVVTETESGYDAVVHLPGNFAEGGTLDFDVRVIDDGNTSGWNTPGEMGTLSFLEPLSYLDVVEAADVPEIDGEEDAAWADANVVETSKQVEGTGGAVGDFRTLWRGDTLYVLATVVDPDVDVSGSDPWAQDSVEFFIDAGNYKNGSYRYDDTQIRISATNALSFGTGDEAFQRARVTSAARLTDDGYVVEAAIDLLEEGGAGTFHGLDFQVNDASGGVRQAVHTWAEPTGTGYQTTARWGVGQLVVAEDDAPPTPTDPDDGATPGDGGEDDGTGGGPGSGGGSDDGAGSGAGSDDAAGSGGTGDPSGSLPVTGAQGGALAALAALTLLLLASGAELLRRRRQWALASTEVRTQHTVDEPEARS